MRCLPRPGVFCIESPAKINLYLKILGRRVDGFHDLQTVMIRTRLADTLHFWKSSAPEITMQCTVCGNREQQIPTDERNLILKAARLLQSASSASFGARIQLWKRIPSEAGLGGGSSNAAAALLALNQLWDLRLDQETLHTLASQLGSDVNFFLDSHVAAICSGRGEQIEPLPMNRPQHLVLIKPPVGLPTPSVFRQWGIHQTSTVVELKDVVENLHHSRAYPGHLVANDLTQPAVQLSPLVAEVLNRLERERLVAHGMSGSGTVCFALCQTARHARTLAGRCRSWNLGRVFVTTTGI